VVTRVRIWVDADACPGPVKAILFRAAERCRVETTLVANHSVHVPRSDYVRAVQVRSGFDVADARIVKEVAPGDLVVTADIPLAAEVIAAGALALNPRGTLYTSENIQEHLARRDFMDQLRATGVVTEGPPALSKVDVRKFANQLDRYLGRKDRAGESE
jgi:uncharacterized protein YaiI (UPF0178 family)